MKLAIERAELEKGLEKLSPVWGDARENSLEELVEFTVESRLLRLRASRWSFAAEVQVPLYETADEVGLFYLSAPEIAGLIGDADSLIHLVVLDNSTCTLSYRNTRLDIQPRHWGVPSSFPSIDDSGTNPVLIPMYVVQNGLEVCEPCLPTVQSVIYKPGVQFKPDSVQATDGQRIGIYKTGTGSQEFAVPAQVIPVIKSMFVHNPGDATIQLRTDSRYMEMAIGKDRVFFRLMSAPFNLKLLAHGLPDFIPAFQADRNGFIFGGGQVSAIQKDRSSIILSRQGEDLLFSAYTGPHKIGESFLRVSWKTPDQNFTAQVNWRAVSSMLSSLCTETVNFGTGVSCGRTFIVFDEDDRRLYVLA